MKDFTDKVVVVTGAGSGMGRAYALEAARRGARLALNDHDAAALDATTALLAPSTEVHAAAFDVADREAVFTFAASVADALGGADVVINNAGVESCAEPIWAITDEQFQRVVDVNFWGVVHGTRAFLPQLLDGDAGAIVNVSSLFGLVGAANQAEYVAAKFAVRGFTESLGAELLHTDVSVHTVHPGGIATNISRRAEGRAFDRKYLKTSPEAIARVVLDAIGTRRTRIVYGHRARTTWLGARFLPQPLMTRLVWRDLEPILNLARYPAQDHAAAANRIYADSDSSSSP